MRWSEQEYEHFKAGRTTAAQAAMKKARDQARADSNKATETAAKELLAYQLAQVGLPAPEWEVRFDPVRKWRFDGAYPESKVGIEIEGGTFAQGRHNRASGFEKDLSKYNAAAVQGWLVLRFTYAMIRSGDAAKTIVACVAGVAGR